MHDLKRTIRRRTTAIATARPDGPRRHEAEHLRPAQPLRSAQPTPDARDLITAIAEEYARLKGGREADYYGSARQLLRQSLREFDEPADHGRGRS